MARELKFGDKIPDMYTFDVATNVFTHICAKLQGDRTQLEGVSLQKQKSSQKKKPQTYLKLDFISET